MATDRPFAPDPLGLREIESALLAQDLLCFFQSAFWHPREQYGVVLHFAQSFRLIPESELVLPQLAHWVALVFASAMALSVVLAKRVEAARMFEGVKSISYTALLWLTA